MLVAVATGVSTGSPHNTYVGADYMKNNVRLCCLPAYPTLKCLTNSRLFVGRTLQHSQSASTDFFLFIDKICSTIVFRGSSPVQL